MERHSVRQDVWLTCLPLPILWAVTAVHHIATSLNGQVSPDGARLGVQGVGCTYQLARAFHHAFTLPDPAGTMGIIMLPNKVDRVPGSFGAASQRHIHESASLMLSYRVGQEGDNEIEAQSCPKQLNRAGGSLIVRDNHLSCGQTGSHCHHRAADDVLHQIFEEGLGAQVLVVLLCQLFAGHEHL